MGVDHDCDCGGSPRWAQRVARCAECGATRTRSVRAERASEGRLEETKHVLQPRVSIRRAAVLSLRRPGVTCVLRNVV